MKQGKEIKQNRTGSETFVISFCIFLPLIPKFCLWKGDWTLDSDLTQFWDFSNIYLFPKIPSLKSFGNSCAIFFVPNTKYHFTYGKSIL